MRRKLEQLAVVTAALTLSLTQAAPVFAAPQQAVNEYLDLDITELMHVTITSVAKKEQRLADSPAAVFVITAEDIRRSGVTSIADALAMAPGLEVAKASASRWSITSRGFAGFTSNKLLVMMDGRSVYSPAYSGTFWDEQNTLLEDIDRIEVIRGPGGTMWGANTGNGVINIITKKAEDTQGALVRIGAGNQDTLTSAGRYGAALGEQTFGRVYLTRDDYAANTLDESGTDANDDWQPFQGGFRLDGRVGGNREWTLQGDLSHNRGDQTLFPYWTPTPPYLTSVADNITTRGGNLVGRWKQALTADSSLTFKAYYDHSDRDERLFRFDFDTIDGDLQYETRLGQRQQLTAGGGYRSVHGRFDQDMFQAHLPDQTNDLYNAFLQDEISLPADVWLTLGAKYEHNDSTGSEWQPSAKMLWKPTPGQSLWFSAGRAVRTPSILESQGRLLIGVQPTPAGLVTTALTGSDTFTSEILWAYESGYRWSASDRLSFDLALFHNEYDQLLSLNPTITPAGYALLYGNGLEGHSQGVEIAIDWRAAHWLSFAAAYTYLTMDLQVADPLALPGMDAPMEQSTPVHHASLRSSIALASQWQLNLWLRYVDAISCLNSTNLLAGELEIGPYTLIDANLIWTPVKNLEIMLAGQNLAKSSQLQYSMEVATPPTAIDRGVYGKITWRF